MHATANHCPLCARTLTRGTTICTHCETQLRQTLALAPRLIRILEDLENPLKSPTLTPSAKPAPSEKPPLRWIPLERADMLTTLIAEYARVLDTTTKKIAESPLIPTSTASPVYAPQIQQAYKRAKQTAFPTPNRQPWGQCPKCGTPLTAPKGSTRITCPKCHTTYTADTLANKVTQHIQPVNLPQSQILKILATIGRPTPESTLRTWIKSGLLESQAVDAGRKLYPLNTAIRLALTHKRKS